MSKTLRIFAKDVRHLWPEILLSLAILAAFVAIEPWNWHHDQHAHVHGANAFIVTVNVLLPLSWWILIARAVQDESLVGDRQFWLTRPYGWINILSAKLIFIFVFIAIPLFFAKSLLLHLAGFSVAHNLSAILPSAICTILLISGILLPLSVISANLIRMFLMMLGGAIFIALAVFLDTHFLTIHSYGPDTAGDWMGPFGVLLCVGIVIFQYMYRRTAISRLIVAGFIVFAVAYSVTAERFWNPHRAYSDLQRGEPIPLLAKLDPSKKDSTYAEEAVELRDDKSLPYLHDKQSAIRLHIPINFSGMPDGSAAAVDNVALSFSFPGQSPIQAGNFLPFTSIRSTGETHILSLLLDKEMVKRYEGQPITIRLTLAVTELKQVRSATSSIEAGRFNAPFGGICYTDTEADNLDSCQFPVGIPKRTLVSTQWSSEPCEDHAPTTDGAFAWIGSETNDAWQPDFDSVEDTNIVLDGRLKQHLCPGTPITFTEYRSARRRLIHITLPPFRFGQSSVPPPVTREL